MIGLKNNKNAGQKKAVIKVSKNGPYLVSGGLPLRKEIITPDRDGIPLKWSKGHKYPLIKTYALCRCGVSKTMPYCDGGHTISGFDGTECAVRKPYLEQAETYRGPALILTDAEKLCAIALFCHRGEDTWNLTEHSGNKKARNMAIQESSDCPSGRLVTWDKKTNKPFEPDFPKSISLIEDPVHHVSGPLWVKGNVSIVSHDDTPYEIRNRVTLCRCGESRNKPFCDGNHISCNFSDGDRSIKSNRAPS
jgi:CDGSH-type Zn-finger protein